MTRSQQTTCGSKGMFKPDDVGHDTSSPSNVKIYSRHIEKVHLTVVGLSSESVLREPHYTSFCSNRGANKGNLFLQPFYQLLIIKGKEKLISSVLESEAPELFLFFVLFVERLQNYRLTGGVSSNYRR